MQFCKHAANMFLRPHACKFNMKLFILLLRRPLKKIKDMLKDLKLASRELLELCSGFGAGLCAAESCTGGMVASSLVSIPGASACFRGSAVCYSDSSKIALLGVSPRTISVFGAESPQCAREMLFGAAQIFKADACISTTGFIDSNTGVKSPEKACKVYVGLSFWTTSKVLELDVSSWRGRNLRRGAVSLFAIEKLLGIVRGVLGKKR